MSSAAGLLIGSMMGSFFLRGFKKWPMYIGGGLGFGMAYSNCENSLNHFLLSMDPKACVIKLVAFIFIYIIHPLIIISFITASAGAFQGHRQLCLITQYFFFFL